MASLYIYKKTQKIRILALNYCNYAAVLNTFGFLSVSESFNRRGSPNLYDN